MKGTNDDIEYSALDGTPRPNFLHRARLNQRVSRTLVVLGSLLFLSIIFATLSSNNPHSSSAARDSQKAGALDTSHFEYLSAPLEDVESSTTDQGTAFIVGEHHLVDGKYPKNYTWIDSYAREPFVEVMYENGLTNSAIARMPAGSPYDVMVVARGRNDKYKDPRESVAYVNLTIVGQVARPQKSLFDILGTNPVFQILRQLQSHIKAMGASRTRTLRPRLTSLATISSAVRQPRQRRSSRPTSDLV